MRKNLNSNFKIYFHKSAIYRISDIYWQTNQIWFISVNQEICAYLKRTNKFHFFGEKTIRGYIISRKSWTVVRQTSYSSTRNVTEIQSIVANKLPKVKTTLMNEHF
jgi:hypothetical protein